MVSPINKYTSFFCLLIAIIPSVLHAQTRSYVNPSAAYCEKMGYKYETRMDEWGNSNGYCILPNDSAVNAWDFFRGKVATEYSYCEKMGYRTEYSRIDTNGYVSECAVCVQTKKSGNEVRISMADLMKQNGEPLIDTVQKKSSNVVYEKSKVNPSLKTAITLPESFDWRNHNGHSYIGGIRNQGGCGSCYAFGANACAEGTYNYANGLYDANCIDLSESFIIWCLGSISPYSSHFGGCTGADYDYMELQALCDSGICNESSFPYVQSNPGSCTHWVDDRIKFNNWYRVDCSDTTGIKTAIMAHGVVDAAVYVSSSFENYTNGIFYDANTSCGSSPCYYTPTNHAIALVGWGHDPTHGLYWILRNSWGTSWGENGYMRIKWNAAVVSCEVCYMEYIVPDANNPTGFNAVPLSESEIELSWLPNPNNDEVLVAWSTDGTFGTPADGIEYQQGDFIPGGGTVLCYEAVNSFIHSLLEPATTYYYKAWSDSAGYYSTGVETNAKTDCIPVTNFPWNEGFENNGSMPDCWSQQQINYSGVNWQFITGNGVSYPATAHNGTYNACLKDQTNASNITRLVSPALNLGNYSDASLIFWHTQFVRTTYQDTLSVFYKTSESSDWILLKSYPTEINTWQPDTIFLPNLSSNYFICFEGDAQRGRGICVDDVSVVTGNYLILQTLTLSDIIVSDPFQVCFNATDSILIAGGGTTVIFQSGSTVNLIAGKSIRFLPGFHAQPESEMYAWITTEEAFCNSLPAPVVLAQTEKSTTINIPEENPGTIDYNRQMKVYPNPTNGHVIVNLQSFEDKTELFVFDQSGKRIYHQSVIGSGAFDITLPKVSPGLYVIRAYNHGDIKSRKLVVY